MIQVTLPCDGLYHAWHWEGLGRCAEHSAFSISSKERLMFDRTRNIELKTDTRSRISNGPTIINANKSMKQSQHSTETCIRCQTWGNMQLVSSAGNMACTIQSVPCLELRTCTSCQVWGNKKRYQARENNIHPVLNAEKM